MKRVLIIIIAALFITSCYKSDLSDTTHPAEGKVAVSIELPTGDIPPSDGYTIIFNGETFTTTDYSTTLDAIVEPGEYYVYVYSNTAAINIEDRTSVDGTIIATAESDEENVKSLNDHAYFGMQRVVVTADAVVTSNISMSQISRDINFNLQIAEGDSDRITSISSQLSGVTSQWECIDDTPHGIDTTIDPSLAQGASIVRSSVDNGYITGSIRVLGINGDEQNLTINLTYSDGKTQKIVSDISDELSEVNSNKSTPITLSGDINTPTEAGLEGTITNWNQINEGNQTVN